MTSEISIADRAWRVALLVIAAAAAAIRLHELDRFSYGLDEILQTYWINGSWNFLWRSLQFDAVHPPLDYAIGRLLEPLGPADWARKLPNVLWGTVTVPVLGLLVARRAGTGRADWRPLARFLRARPEGEWVFTENQYVQLCLAFYLVGPDWGYQQGKLGRRIPNLDGEIGRLSYSWAPGTTAWVVTGASPSHPDLREWLRMFSTMPFPTAEGCVLYRLDPARRPESFEVPR